MNARRSVPFSAASIAVILLGALAASDPVQEPAVIKPRASFRYSLPLLCMAVSPDGKTVAYSDNTGTQVWDVATGKRTATLRGKPSKDEPGALSLAYRPDGKVLAVGSAHRKGREVRVHDLATAKSTQLKLSRGPVSFAFSADGAFLITVAPGTNITAWDTKTGKAVTTLPGLLGGGSLCLRACTPPCGAFSTIWPRSSIPSTLRPSVAKSATAFAAACSIPSPRFIFLFSRSSRATSRCPVSRISRTRSSEAGLVWAGDSLLKSL
jgi:hypothetical protein